MNFSNINEHKSAPVGNLNKTTPLRCCFVKRIKPGSVAEKSGHIHVGDQLCKLGDVSLVGCRHYAVAAKLRDVPVRDEFAIL